MRSNGNEASRAHKLTDDKAFVEQLAYGIVQAILEAKMTDQLERRRMSGR